MISEFNRFFSSHSLASTYKPTFLKCLLDLGDYKEDEGSQWVKDTGDRLIVDLNFVAARFLRYYWPLRFKFKLKQEASGMRIAVYRILEKYDSKIGVKSTPPKNLMCSESLSELRKITIKDGIQPQVLGKLLNDCNIYSINRGRQTITIKKEIVDFMKANKKILESALNYMITKYLETINTHPNIAITLQEKINRTSLKQSDFAKIISGQKSRCFYCDCKGNSFAQEHFIPWNWITDTKNFNIVAACKTCNSSKNDKLPEDRFLRKIIARNSNLANIAYGYTTESFEKIYHECYNDYHGKDQPLWKPVQKNDDCK